MGLPLLNPQGSWIASAQRQSVPEFGDPSLPAHSGFSWREWWSPSLWELPGPQHHCSHLQPVHESKTHSAQLWRHHRQRTKKEYAHNEEFTPKMACLPISLLCKSTPSGAHKPLIHQSKITKSGFLYLGLQPIHWATGYSILAAFVFYDQPTIFIIFFTKLAFLQGSKEYSAVVKNMPSSCYWMSPFFDIYCDKVDLQRINITVSNDSSFS